MVSCLERATLTSPSSEKAPHMFGMLVVSLPSKHTGGALHVIHAGKQHIFETSTTSEYNTSMLAW